MSLKARQTPAWQPCVFVGASARGMKRGADKQLTQLSAAADDDDDDDDDDAAPQGTWKAAPPEVLAQRRIVKAHRPSASGPSNPSANPFAKTSLAGAPAAEGAKPFTFAMPAMQTRKPQPPLAACDSGFFKGAGGGAWGSGGGGFGAASGGGGGFASVPSIFSAPQAGSPAAAEPSPFAGLSGGSVFSSFGRNSIGSKGGDEDEDGDGDGEAAEEELAIVAAPKMPIVETLTGEEDELCVHKVRAKVFILEVIEGSSVPVTADASASEASASEGKEEGAPGAEGAPAAAAAPNAPATRWVERGVGALHLNVHNPPPSPAASEFVPGAPAHAAGALKKRPPRLVMRVEHVGRLILNMQLLPSMPPPAKVSETSIRVNSLGNALGEWPADETPPSFQCLIRVKTAPEAVALLQALTDALEVAAPKGGKGKG
mmetsp:Transcript_40705/g.100745  ORF Transcript_40705/g.100745 Transcript_40705/m.100745 type:complete len:429 (+) Transcript_40705:113-1399(+)